MLLLLLLLLLLPPQDGSHTLTHTQGCAGSRPSPRQLAEALQHRDLYLYFGHGGGEQYVPLAALKRLARCAGALLMGCSSGRLRQAGLYEPSGPILGYLMAGCPTAVANLWDVTDRDIDRFAEQVLDCWGGHADCGDGGDGQASCGQRPEAGGGASVSASVAVGRRARAASRGRLMCRCRQIGLTVSCT
jgi:separase